MIDLIACILSRSVVFCLILNRCFGSWSGIRCLCDPWIRDPGWVKNQATDRDEQPNHVSESLETIFGIIILKFFDADPGSRIEKIGSGIRDGKIRIRDLGWKNSDPG
jgi:hypothetical protein